ncbi:MAG TPA: DUF5134 domain-containing protein [Streptosporangiaceae bacterium]|jgi:hypothetical protein
MTGPAWLAALFAAVMLLVAASSLVRLALWRLRGRAAEPEVDVLHVLMGVAMAAMFERISPVRGTAWLALFAAAAAWFACRAVGVRRAEQRARSERPDPGGWRCAHPAPHVVECVAMVYMLVPARGADHRSAVAAMPGMAGATATANPAVALLLAMFMLGYILWTAERLTSQARARAAPARARLAPGAEVVGHQTAGVPTGVGAADRAAACSKMAMSLAMGYMLLTTL